MPALQQDDLSLYGTEPHGEGNDLLREEVNQLRQQLAALQDHYEKYYSAFRFRLAELLHRVARRWWLVLPTLSVLVRAGHRIRRWLGHGGEAAIPRLLDRLLFLDPPLYWLCKPAVRAALKDFVDAELRPLRRRQLARDPAAWFQAYRPTSKLLGQLGARRWPAAAPTFTVLLRLGDTTPDRLRNSLHSVKAQVYPRWELFCLTAPTCTPELREVLAEFQKADVRFRGATDGWPTVGAASAVLRAAHGQYACLLDAGDALEPQALYRFADAVLEHAPDMLYSDAVRTTADLDEVIEVAARPQFAYDHYLCNSYLSHLVGFRMGPLRALTNWIEPDAVGVDEELVLRFLERARSVVHVPDILYRQSVVVEAAPQRACQAVADHLQRLGSPALVRPLPEGGRDVRFPVPSASRVAVIIPTKNRHDLLRQCLDALGRTVPRQLADVYVIDHESDDPETLAYLRGLDGAVLRHEGPFNFSRMMNQAVARLSRPASHYLFLNNDTESLRPGWLEHMLGLAGRADVGAVGALLLYPDGRVQHAGAVVGLHYAADHAPKAGSMGEPGMLSPSMLTTREQGAVTGACLLVRAEVFHQVGGFDPRFAVGFGDTDFCLRVRARGYKVLLDAQATLLHHESATRKTDPHPLDTQRFRARYLEHLLVGDPFYSPLWSRQRGYALNPYARAADQVHVRSVPVVPPTVIVHRSGSAAA